LVPKAAGLPRRDAPGDVSRLTDVAVGSGKGVRVGAAVALRDEGATDTTFSNSNRVRSVGTAT